MALEDWTDEEEDSDSNDDGSGEMSGLNTPDNEEPQTTKRAIAANIQARAMKGEFGLEIEDGYVEGHIEDLAMMFAVMTMDFEESEFQDLVTDDAE